MPNIKSSVRSVKTDTERNARNSAMKSAIKTVSRKLRASAKAASPEESAELLKKASSLIDKAAKKGVLHKNTAARKKSRLAKRANKAEK